MQGNCKQIHFVVTRDLEIEASHFNSRFDKRPVVRRLRISTVLGEKHAVRNKKDGPAISFATYHAGATRGNSGVKKITGAMLDFDHISPSEFLEIQQQCASTAHVMYSTYSHLEEGSDDFRFRVFFPISRAITPIEYPIVFAKLSRRFGLKNDKQAKDLARLFYVPSCPPSRAAHAFIDYVDGPPLDVDGYLLAAETTAVHSRNSGSGKAAESGCSGPVNKPLFRGASIRHLEFMGVGCFVLERLLQKAATGEHLDNTERVRLAQIAIAAGLDDESIVSMFKRQNNFSHKTSLYQVRAMRVGHRTPACKRIAEDLSLCGGRCSAIKAIRGAWSPAHLLPEGKPSEAEREENIQHHRNRIDQGGE